MICLSIWKPFSFFSDVSVLYLKQSFRGYNHENEESLKNMKKYFNVLQLVGLFRGIDTAELEAMLKCLGAEVKDVRKDIIILFAGDKPQSVGIVLTGQLHIIREDYDGNRSLISAVTPGEIFAEALCCAGIPESPVTVIADTDSTVMLLSFQRILHICPNSCTYHTKLIENMLGLVANKNLQLQSRMEIISLKSVRAKVLRYFESLAQQQGRKITIPFNREEMADFLCVERSALSHELAKMKKDGLIDYRKSNFILNI
jgi:CRP-like cAMP-binding protein